MPAVSLAVRAVVLVAAFAVCAWSGRTLAGHYQDRWELAATLAVGACLFGAAGLASPVRGAAAEWLEAALSLAMAAGLFTGYYRAGDRRRV